MKRSDHEIVQKVLDGSVSKEAFDGFQERMRGEPELVKLYGDYANLHHSLAEEFEDEPVSARPVAAPRRAIPKTAIWLAAAAVVAIAAVVIQRKTATAAVLPPLVADVRFSADAVWSVEGVSRKSGDATGLGKGATLKLEMGQARVLTNASASALVEGPATLTLVSGEALHLASGRGRFLLEKAGGSLEVSTSSMTAQDLGTEFGVDVRADLPDELHVFDGKVKMRINGRSESEILTSGEAGRVAGPDHVEKFAADDRRFAKKLGDFKSVVGGRFVKADWREDYGNPSVTGDEIGGENYAVFLKLPEPVPAEGSPVLLATLKVNKPSAGVFHTDGWAGMSFFRKGVEVVFFGDAFGPEITWSLDVKQRIPVILPVSPVVGPRTVTLRYDRRTGAATLHEGEIPLGKAFCSGKIPKGLEFDEIRLGASSGAALKVDSLTIRAGGF